MANTNTSYNDTDPKEFDRFGHPGKFWHVYSKHTGGVTHFTGSNYGCGGATLSSGSVVDFTATDYVELSGGGNILLNDLPSLESNILDISVRMVSSSVSAPSINFFKRQV